MVSCPNRKYPESAESLSIRSNCKNSLGQRYRSTKALIIPLRISALLRGLRSLVKYAALTAICLETTANSVNDSLTARNMLGYLSQKLAPQKSFSSSSVLRKLSGV